jgi:branched-subunit amino acid transport protein
LGIPSAGLRPIYILALLFLHPKILEKIFNRILGLLRREPVAIPISYSEILCILGVCVLSWVAGGIGFYFFMDGVFPVSSKYFLFLTGALAFSSTLGLIALFAPSGLGVREGALVYLLSFIMPGSVAVIISILSRIWMTFIEIGLIGIVYLLGKVLKGFGKRDPYVKT